MKTGTRQLLHPAPPRVSARVVRFFAAYSRQYLSRHFHSIRISTGGLPQLPQGDLSRPLVIYLNHASWWDPLVCLRLSRSYFADRTSFAPIDAAALGRYRFFKSLGFYGVEQQSLRGARMFLRTSRAILRSERNMIWLTPQGRFSDARERPLRLQRGIGALAAEFPEAAFVPLAIEYAFWTEPRPEILLSFGKCMIPADEPARGAGAWTDLLSASLESAQDDLAARSRRRDPAEWLVLDRGTSGVNAIYDGWRWLRSKVTGVAHTTEHQPEKPR
jgi:1-acyl-sn-glycerol-3-phosphate acyltransferase